MDYPLGQRLRELTGPLLLTGHTGFKGTWMSFLLEHLNVQLVGYSLLAEKESLYDRADRKGVIPEAFGDIRDYELLEKFIDLHKPSTIIHMAAQPLVLKSYETPRETFDVNVMGTVNVLDIAFRKDYIKSIIIVTTDKVYRNDDSGRAFSEHDPLQGKDPYSASKVGTEAVVAAWQQISKIYGGPNVVSVRSGNVIGGGDYSENRLMPDLIKSALENKSVSIRNPEGTRPWLHVLDTSIGYIRILEKALEGEVISAINFAPHGEILSVRDIVSLSKSTWPEIQFEFLMPNKFLAANKAIEAQTLSLDATLARDVLEWKPSYSQTEAVVSTVKWWQSHLKGENAGKTIINEINSMFETVKNNNRV
jgi:CDP-glucose 4,6-dehydratase